MEGSRSSWAPVMCWPASAQRGGAGVRRGVGEGLNRTRWANEGLVGLAELVRLPAEPAWAVRAGGVRHRGEPDADTRPLATDRVAITSDGLQRAGADAFRQALCAAVQERPGVAWAVVNAPLRRLRRAAWSVLRLSTQRTVPGCPSG